MAVETIEDLCEKARQSVMQGDHEEAQKLYKQALSQQADASDALYGLGTVAFMQKDLDAAIDYFQQVLQFEPRRASVHINLGAIFNRQGKMEKAIESLRRGIQLDPHRAEGYYNLGLVYKSKGDTNLAVQAYREAIRLNPRMADAHLNLANILRDRHEYVQARTSYQQALQLQPDWEPAVKGLARVEAGEQTAKRAAAKTPTAVPVVSGAGDDRADDTAIDYERTVDPKDHGDYLTFLHRTAIETEGQALQCVQQLLEEIEPAVKELSSVLLVHEGLALALDLDQSLARFEQVIEKFAVTYKSVNTNLDRLRDKTQKLLHK